MDNKVIVHLVVPEIEQEYDMYLPVNKKIGNIVTLLNNAINESNNMSLDLKCLYNAESGVNYEYNILLLNTDIRNGTRLVITQ